MLFTTNDLRRLASFFSTHTRMDWQQMNRTVRCAACAIWHPEQSKSTDSMCVLSCVQQLQQQQLQQQQLHQQQQQQQQQQQPASTPGLYSVTVPPGPPHLFRTLCGCAALACADSVRIRTI